MIRAPSRLPAAAATAAAPTTSAAPGRPSSAATTPAGAAVARNTRSATSGRTNSERQGSGVRGQGSVDDPPPMTPGPSPLTPMLTDYLKETEQLAERVDELGRHL